MKAQIDISKVTSSLSEYSPTVSNMVDMISKAIEPIAYVLLSVLFLQELLSWYKFSQREGSGISLKTWVEISIKYLIAYFLIAFNQQIFETILWFFNGTIGIIDKVITGKNTKVDYDIGKVKGITKIMMSILVYMVENISGIVGNILVMLRFLQMYLLKAIAPLMVGFYMSESTRQLSTSFIRHFSAYAFQGLLLIIVVKIYPSLMTDALLQADVSEKAQVFSVAVSSIVKGIVFIVLLVGTNKLSKQLFGVS